MINVIKLITGEKIIGFCIFYEDDGAIQINIKHPHLLVEGDELGEYTLERYDDESDEEIENLMISNVNVIYITKPKKVLESMFSEVTGMKNVVAFSTPPHLTKSK